VKLLASAAALLCAVAAGVAAPALSAGRWHPKPVDFELAPKSSPAGAMASRALRAPKRFNLVGLRWRGHAEPRIALRVRERGGRWSRWARVEAEGDHRPDRERGERAASGSSSPVWVGEADYVQYRLSRRVADLRLHFVNARGSATAADRARTALRRGVSTATAAVAGIFGTSAQAQEPQPGMVLRAGWGASNCPPRAAPEHGSVKAAYVHHTVSLNDYSPAEAPDIVLSICRYHRNSNGWNDIGYNFLVDKYGVIYEGRAGGVDRAVIGAQAQGFNSQTTGISNIGDYSWVGQTPQAIDAMSRLIRWKLPLHGVPTTGSVTLTSAGGDTSRYRAGARVTVQRVLGHRDTNTTACPGDALYAQLPELRARVAGASPIATGATRLSAALASTHTTYGRPVLFQGVLSSGSGPLEGEAVEVQSLRAGRWVTSRRVRSGAGGLVTALVKPKASGRVRLRYAGHSGLRASASRSGLLRVRSLVSLRKPPAAGARGVALKVGGKVSPAKRLVYLVLQQKRGGVFKRVGQKAVRTSRGRFGTSFVPARAGSYRFYLVAKADRLTDRGRSRLQQLRVRRLGGGAPAGN